MKRLALLAGVVLLLLGLILGLPRFVHPRLEAELSRSLHQPVKFENLRLRSTGAELTGLKYGDFLTARQVDAVIDWASFDLHPQKLVLKGVEMRLDNDVLAQLGRKHEGGSPRRFPLIFEDGRLLLWGVADVAPLKGEWDTDNRLTLEHPVGGRWTLNHGQLSVERASLVALAAWAHQQLPIDPNLLGSAVMVFGHPWKAEFTVPWGVVKVEGERWTSERLGPFTDVIVDVDVARRTLSGEAHLGRDHLTALCSWKGGQLVAELNAAHLAFGEVEVSKVDFDLQGQVVKGTLGGIKFRRLVTGPASIDLLVFPVLDGGLHFVQPLSLEKAQAAGLVPRLGINLGGVGLRGLRFSGTPLAPKIVPQF